MQVLTWNFARLHFEQDQRQLHIASLNHIWRLFGMETRLVTDDTLSEILLDLLVHLTDVK